MKNCKRIPHVWVIIYSNFWYIPLFGLLIGLKICLISFFITSCFHSEMEPSQSPWAQSDLNSERNIHLSKGKRHTSLKLLRISTATSKSTRRHSRRQALPISSEKLEEWSQLANLTEARIRPSHSNRTESESIWLIFNRIPRSGGTTFVKLLEKLSEGNGFSHQEHEYRTPWPRFLLDQEQESLVTWFEYQHRPKSYDRHFYFVNFTKYQKYVKEKPIYINMLRDPIHRIRSEFIARRNNKDLAQLEINRRDAEVLGSGQQWYQREFEDCVLNSDQECDYETGGKDFTLTVPFFCGQFNSCVIINDKWGLQMAKFTIERHYSVVGVLERMDQTLAVLEKYVPKFFSGITQFYTQLDPKDQLGRNFSSVSDAVREILEKKLAAEVDLYRFVNQRLSLQHAHLSGGTY